MARRRPSKALVRAPLVGALSALSLILAILGPAPAAAAQEARVSMKGFAFDPAEITIDAGDTVAWTYDESATDPAPNCESPYLQLGVPGVGCPGHSTTAADKDASGRPLWDSGVHRAEGFPFRFVFTKPGRYPYFCVVHGGSDPNNPFTDMNGVIVVRAQAAVLHDKRIAPSKRAELATSGVDARALTAVALLLVVSGAAARVTGRVRF